MICNDSVKRESLRDAKSSEPILVVYKKSVETISTLFFALLLAFITAGCHPQYRLESVEQVHSDPSFESSVEEGRKLLLYPVIFNDAFIVGPSFEEFTRPLDLRHDRLEISWYENYKESITDSMKTARLLRIEKELLEENSLDIPSFIDYFDNSGFRFLQIFRIRKTFIAGDNSGAMVKHLTLDGEVWDVRKRGVVWRSSSVVETEKTGVSDKEMLLRGVELLYETLPKFYFNSTEREW